jgi:hypothetical protein
VKNQYFGDNRDLLKFDLVFQIVKEGLADRFSYIPMLTEDVAEADGPDVRRCEASGGVRNAALVDLLDKSIINQKREIGQLDEFFKGNGIEANIYQKDVYFTHEGRKSYFSGIPRVWLTRSLILVDPDRGLEEDSNGAGNLLYSELAALYERMDDDSYLMFTQRFPYDLYEAYLGMRCAELKDRIPGSQPVSIDDLDSIIFFLTRNKFLQGRLVNLLKDYTQQYAKKD